jgi:hypothetical protein
MIAPEQILANFERLKELCGPKNLEARSEPTIKMIDALGDRLAMCPGSGRVEYHNAFPGGLVEHSLRVLDLSLQWWATFKRACNSQLRRDSIVIAALFHDLGKVGDHEQDYYVAQTNQWRADKLGEVYEYNRNLTYMSVPQRGLWLMQHFGVVLTQDEYLAILLNDGQYPIENKPYGMKEPDLAVLVHQSDLIATRFEKERAQQNS